MNITWTAPTPELTQKVATNMRPSDVREVWLSAGLEPLDALNMLVYQSTVAFVACVDGEPVYMFGGTEGPVLNTDVGTCWGLGTSWLDSHGISMAKLTKRGWAMLWDALPNVQTFHCRIWANCHKTLVWAEWMGANLRMSECVHGVKGGVFVPYTIDRR